MNVTAIKHYDEFMGNGYYVVGETFDRLWYKGETAMDAVKAFCKQYHISEQSITIYEER